MIRLHLPFPPSVNSLYPGNGRRRWKSKAYEEWIREAGLMLNSQSYRLISIPVSVTYKVGGSSKRRMDISNREKALSDILVKHQVIKDDSLIYRLVMEWADIEGVDVEIIPYTPV